MGARDGDGWVFCEGRHWHWGRHGAAGLLMHYRDLAGVHYVLLQHRASWSHEGDTWGVPGGARDSHETTVAAALRECGEELLADLSQLAVGDVHRENHGGWYYDTVLARLPGHLPVAPANEESQDVRWVVAHEVEALPLHSGFARNWPRLRGLIMAEERVYVPVADLE